MHLFEAKEPEFTTALVEVLVVVAEFLNTIYPGLISTGKVERGDAIYIDPPYNTGARD